MTKRLAIIVCTILLGLCLLWWLHMGPEGKGSRPGESDGGNPITNKHSQNIPPSGPLESGRPSQKHAPRKEGGSAPSYQELLEDWQRPIDFYGKVVDEMSNSVPNAQVSFTWIESLQKGGTKTSVAYSDPGGLFTLHNVRGGMLDVRVEKPGYFAPKPGVRVFRFGIEPYFVPDPNDPVVFPLKRQNSGVELLTSESGMRPDLSIRLPRDGTSVRVSLLEKRRNSSGELELSQNKPTGTGTDKWSFRLAVPNGGLIENSDEFPFEAPAKGYKPVLEFEYKKDETNWITHVEKQFYITFGQPPKFGWLLFESDLSQETVFLKYAINTSGSRNLEPK